MKNYFISGANSTSAKKLAEILLANNSSKLGLFCRNSEALKTEFQKLNFNLENCYFYEGDAKNFEQVQSSVQNFFSQVQTIQGLAHFPGSVLLKPATSTKIEEFEEVISTNLTSAFLILKSVLPIFKEQDSSTVPSVVFLSSVAASRGLPNHEAIAAAKGGLEAMARSVAASYPNVRCNCVAPGLIDAKMTSKLVQSERALAASLSLNAIKRAGSGLDIAQAVEFLLSDKSNFITGQVLGVDGGMSTLGFPK
jgi:3-oxoacyl-[acyl-carrier protein] reductase